MVWYTGQFYALFFLQQVLKVDGYTANLLIAWSLLLGTPFFVVFGWLSDKIGRKPIILAGCLLAALTYFPLFKALTEHGQPGALPARRQRRQVDGRGRSRRTARSSSTRSAPPSSPAPATSPRGAGPRRRQLHGGAAAGGAIARSHIGATTIDGFDAAHAGADAKAKPDELTKAITEALAAAPACAASKPRSWCCRS